MDGIRLGACMFWKPATSGVSAQVTVIDLDLARDRALVHVRRASTQTCAAHWVDADQLSEAPRDAHPCDCVTAVNQDGQGNDAA